MEYNTQRKKMELPEYGRSVQNMVDHALTIEDREERQRCADTIVNIMGGMFPHLRDVPDFKHKLWDHLAIMSDFKLDIDYPFEIVKKEDLVVKPEQLAYPNADFLFVLNFNSLLHHTFQESAIMTIAEICIGIC